MFCILPYHCRLCESQSPLCNTSADSVRRKLYASNRAPGTPTAHPRRQVGMAAKRAGAARRWKNKTKCKAVLSCVHVRKLALSFFFSLLSSLFSLLSSLFSLLSSPCRRSLATPRSQESSHSLDSISSLFSILSSPFHILSSLLHLLSSFNKPCCQTIWAFQAFFFSSFLRSLFSLLRLLIDPGKCEPLSQHNLFSSLFSLLSG